MKIEKIKSDFDNLEIEIAISLPKSKPIGIIQFAHGMSENKERYFEFMKFLSENGYICVINDHRGHGNSVKNNKDYGYFYTENANAIVEDFYQVTKYIKEKYKNLDVYIFSHSMGTLVVRNYLKKYDDEVKKIVLCGPPTYNPLTSFGIVLAKVLKIFQGEETRSKVLNKLVIGKFSRKYKDKNEWICSNPEVVDKYEDNEKTGFVFTINGFINLFKLMKGAFSKKGWKLKNKNLEILAIAGEDDPVIQNKKKFNNLIQFLRERGYEKISSKMYPNKRHELLNEVGRWGIYQDILDFFNN